MTIPKLSIKNAIHYGWRLTKSNFKLFSLFLITVFILRLSLGFFQNQVSHWLVGLFSFVIYQLIRFGTFSFSLKTVTERPIQIRTLYNKLYLFPSYFIATLLYWLIVSLGLILLIIPGIYLAISLQFYPYLILDQNITNPFKALKQCFKLTQNYRLTILLLNLTLFILIILGALSFVIGLLITVPINLVALAYTYKFLQLSKTSSPNS